MTHTHTQQKSSQSALKRSNLAIVGLARNCEKTIRADIERLKGAVSDAKSIVWLIVESDSTDNTVIELKKLQNEIKNFQFVSLGILEKLFRNTPSQSHIVVIIMQKK